MVYTTHYQSPLGALLLAARGDALAIASLSASAEKIMLRA